MTAELKGCPICGGEGRYWHDWSSVAVMCSNKNRFPDPCPMRLQGPTKQSKEEAAEAWNTRASPPADELIEALAPFAANYNYTMTLGLDVTGDWSACSHKRAPITLADLRRARELHGRLKVEG